MIMEFCAIKNGALLTNNQDVLLFLGRKFLKLDTRY